MRHQGDRRHDRRRPALPFRVYGLRAFDQAPAVVVSRFDSVDELPKLPPDIADPQVAGLAVEAHLPRIPHAVRPDFAARRFEIRKRIVFGNAVGEPVFRMIDVDPQNR